MVQWLSVLLSPAALENNKLLLPCVIYAFTATHSSCWSWNTYRKGISEHALWKWTVGMSNLPFSTFFLSVCCLSPLSPSSPYFPVPSTISLGPSPPMSPNFFWVTHSRWLLECTIWPAKGSYTEIWLLETSLCLRTIYARYSSSASYRKQRRVI